MPKIEEQCVDQLLITFNGSLIDICCVSQQEFRRQDLASSESLNRRWKAQISLTLGIEGFHFNPQLV